MCNLGAARLKREMSGQLGPLLWQRTEKEEGDSAIPSSWREARMDCALSPTGEEVVLDISQVVVGTSRGVVGTSQEGMEAVVCQTIRP